VSVSDPRILSRNATSGITDYFHWDPVTEGFVVEQVQDAEPTIEANKLIANSAAHDWKGDMHHVARIPLVILEKLRKEGILSDKKRFLAWLDDRENRVFRTHGGKL
jgi:hypothetical protein